MFKNTLAIAALLVLTAGSAKAETISSFAIGSGPNKFVKRYSLNSFNIATDSTRLRGIGEIESGTVEINEGTNELRLHLDRKLECGENMPCLTVMPNPTVITLPIQHMESNDCGGLTIIAERNLQLVDAGLTRIELQDLNGTRCNTSSLLAVVKRVKVVVLEQGVRDRSDVMSVMSGLPLAR